MSSRPILRPVRLSSSGALALALSLPCAALGCDDSATFPLDIEVRDGVGTPGKPTDVLELFVKTVPGADVRFEDQERSVGDRANETFSVPKSGLKLGANKFQIDGTRGVLLSKAKASATATWEGTVKSFVSFYPTGGDGGLGSLACGSTMCAGTTFKIGKDGKFAFEAESAAAGWLSIAGRRESVGPKQRKTFEIDLARVLGQVSLAERELLSIPFLLEIGPDKGTETLELKGPTLSRVLTATLARVEAGPVAFGGEGEAPAAPRSVAVVGLPSKDLIVVGKAAKAEELDLVTVARTAERVFACGTSAAILYLDQELSTFDRRTGKSVDARKLFADRVSCPRGANVDPRMPRILDPSKAPAGQIRAEVRETDLVRALSELLPAAARTAEKPAPK